MRKELVRRLEALEQAPRAVLSTEELGAIETARRVSFVLSLGALARTELDAAGASMDPERRAKLTERIRLARSIAATLERFSPSKPKELDSWH